MCGPCCYYKSCLVITPQILSIVAFLISFGWYAPWWVGMVVMIIQQVLWCTKCKPLFWVLVPFSLVAAALNFYTGYAMVNTVTPDFCWPMFTIEYMCNDARLAVSIMSYISGGLWVISAILNLIFVLKDDDDEEEAKEEDDDEAVAVAVQPQASEDV